MAHLLMRAQSEGRIRAVSSPVPYNQQRELLLMMKRKEEEDRIRGMEEDEDAQYARMMKQKSKRSSMLAGGPAQRGAAAGRQLTPSRPFVQCAAEVHTGLGLSATSSGGTGDGGGSGAPQRGRAASDATALQRPVSMPVIARAPVLEDPRRVGPKGAKRPPSSGGLSLLQQRQKARLSGMSARQLEEEQEAARRRADMEVEKSKWRALHSDINAMRTPSPAAYRAASPSTARRPACPSGARRSASPAGGHRAASPAGGHRSASPATPPTASSGPSPLSAARGAAAVTPHRERPPPDPSDA